MNKKLLAIMIAATLLQGCTSFRQAENTRKDAVAEQQRAREMIAELRNRTPVVKESPRQWINPRPVTDKNPGNAVPGCPIIINTRQSITLQQVAQRISENCHIPVRITPDVQAYLSVTTSGSTQQIQGTVPPPDTGGMVPLAAIGSSDTTLPRLQGNTASLPELKASGLTSLLNAVASRLGISWRYDGSHITFYYLDTRTFPVTYMDSQVAYNATVVSGTMSSNGSSGGTASDAISGDASNTQTTTVDMKSALYQDVKNAVSSMLTPGIGRMFMSTGFITVTDTGAPGTAPHASPSGTVTSQHPRLQETSLATPATRQGIQLIPALTRVPAYIDTAVDSDNAVSRVVASVPAGPWAGAVLYSQDARLAGQGMDIHFDRMMWRGMFLKVNAYALNERTGMSTVASDVNHRWFKHIVLPSVLGGVGNVGSLYKDANTQILQGNYGSITGRVGMPDGEALAGVIAGGMAERGSQLLTRQAESEPYRQVTVSRGEVVSILFVEPVMSNDISTPSSGTAPSESPSSGRPLTQAEAEHQASDRIRAAVLRKQNEMQQRYGIQQESYP